MSLQFFTPEQEAALEEASAAFQRLGEMIKEFVDNIARDFKELMETMAEKSSFIQTIQERRLTLKIKSQGRFCYELF